jgi:hypothetical protein
MARSKEPKAIVPLPEPPRPERQGDPQRHEAWSDTPTPSGTTDVTAPTGRWVGMLDRALSVQRPAVLAYVRGVRRRHPNATPAEIITILERHYLVAVSTGGAAVGATAVIPAVGFATSLGLSGVETLGFLETTALFAQSVTEVHGIAVDDPERARTLVMAMILGTPGTQLVTQLAGQAAGGQARTAFWGELVTSSLPKQIVGGIGGQLRDRFVKRFAASQGASIVGRAMPFGIGAVVGGVGNHALGKRVVKSARTAFGTAPDTFAEALEPRTRVRAPLRPGTLDPRRAIARFRNRD